MKIKISIQQIPLHFLYILFFTFIFQGNVKSQNNVNYQDCTNSFPICDLKTYHFGQMKGTGKVNDKVSGSSCFGNDFSETNSFWLKWKADRSGTLTFVINPNKQNDDFDFILYQRDIDDCFKLTEVRCMGAGQNIGEEEDPINLRCKGSTGLSISSIDEFESQGCKYASDNFLKMLHVEKDEEYVLLVNNYESTVGYSITFEGNTTLRSYDECKILTTSEPVLIVNLYPNPAINSVNVEYLSQSNDKIQIDMLDITGKLYHQFDIIPELGKNKNTFLLNDMSKGSYILRIKQGEFTTVRQFIKQ